MTSLTPIWYSYEPGGDVLMHTGAGSPKTAMLTTPSRTRLRSGERCDSVDAQLLHAPLSDHIGHSVAVSGG